MPFSRALPSPSALGSIIRILLVSSVSIALAIISALLMAFIQYQDRLLKAQPRVTTAQLMSDVQAEDALKEVFVKIDGQALTRITTGTTYAMALSERDQRASRLCATIMTEDPGDAFEKRRRVCITFLSNIPFDRGTADAKPVIGADDLPVIKERFVQQVPIHSEDDKTVLGWLRLFDNDFRKIAQLNLDLVEYSSKVIIAEQALQESCRTALYTSQAIRYRDVDLGNCNAVLLREAQTTQLAAALNSPRQQLIGSRTNTPVASQQTNLPSAIQDGNLFPGTFSSGAGAPGVPPNSNIGALTGAFDANAKPEASQAEKQLEFELVDHYRFYKGISWLHAEHLLLSPGEFLILMLVGVSGMMGAFLKMVYSAFSTGRNPQIREFCLEPVLGLICALTIYILLRAGFLVLTDPTHSNGAASLSPFIVAFVSMGGGLASERAMVLFRSSLNSVMGIDEVAQRPRYAVRLESEMTTASMSPDGLAKVLDVAPDLVGRWIAQDETVPANFQREIGLVLKAAPRTLFTDLPPT